MPSKVPSVLVAGASMGVLIALVRFIPVVGTCLSCIAIAAAGVLSVWHYTSEHRLTITGGEGAGMGAMAALVAGITDSLIGLILAVLGMAVGIGQMRVQMIEAMEDAGYDEETLRTMEEVLEADWFIPTVLFCSFVIYMIIGAIGGIIGAASFKEGEEPGGAGPGEENTPAVR